MYLKEGDVTTLRQILCMGYKHITEKIYVKTTPARITQVRLDKRKDGKCTIQSIKQFGEQPIEKGVIGVELPWKDFTCKNSRMETTARNALRVMKQPSPFMGENIISGYKP